nr:zinc finger, CCHC-type [Tanacetum cinerariifolium]
MEPHRNVDHVVGSQKVQTQDLIYYHPARDREKHSAWKLFSYREDSNEAAFAVAAVDMIYAHESLTFNNTVACEVIFKWKAGLKDDMDARSYVYVLNNGCRKYNDDSDVYYWKYTPDQSGNTLRVSQSRFYNGKLVQTLLEGHFILSLEGSLSGDCDVEKNGKWSYIYAVGSQKYQVVCTRPDIASADVGMLDVFYRGLHTYVHVFVYFDYDMGRSITVIAGYMTLTEAAKEATGLKGLAKELGFELKIVAGIATGALSKAIPSPRFQHWLKLLRIEEG